MGELEYFGCGCAAWYHRSCLERYVRIDVKQRAEAAEQAVAMGSRIIKSTSTHPPRCPTCKRKVDASLSLRKAPKKRVRA